MCIQIQHFFYKTIMNICFSSYMNFSFGEVGVNIFSFYINKNLILHKFNLGLNASLSILKALKSVKLVS